ncbi:MAG: tripartite tricarboxylate transporter substrate binding protein, partial [Caldimonas sp.]
MICSIQRTLASLLGAAALAAATTALAQTGAAGFPNKPMKIVVTFSTGGAPDILARLIGDRLTADWGQPVVIDNKPGAGGNTGADFVAKAPADGYTIVVGTVGTHSINGALYAKMPYDMVRDFAPVTLLATTPNLLVINNDVPAKNLKEFIALGKKEGKMTFASSGSGTSIHVSGELFKTMTGIDMTHIPYKGRATAIPDVLGGRVTMMFDNMPSSLPLVKEGKLRALGVTSAQRSAAAPEIPTIAEQGLPGFEAVSWFAL